MPVLSPLDTTWLLLSAFLVMIMQAGFCLFETGLVRSKNSINVAFKNVSDFTVAALTYWFIGYAIMYGDSIGGLFGFSGLLYSHDDGRGAWFVYQVMFCCAAATIVGGALAERTRFNVYLILSVVIAGFVYPVVGHWIWATAPDGAASGWLASLGFIDFAGGTAVHGVGGWLALAAVLVVGPRLGRFSDDASSSKLKGSNYPLAAVGVILLWFGWFGFNGGSAVGFNESIPMIIINTSLSAAAGATALLLWGIFRTGKPNIGGVLKGTLAGLVGVTAGCHLFSTTDAIIVGVLSAFAAQTADVQLERRKIDDAIGAFPVHAVAGAVGTLLIAILGDPQSFPANHTMLEQLGVQLIGVASVGLWAFGVGYGVITILNHFTPLRVSEEDERIGLNVSEHDANTETLDLLQDMSKHRDSTDFTSKVHVEPHTEVGQIAAEYNEVLERVRVEIQTREEAYKQLKEASHFQFIFENTREGIIQLAMDGSIQQANPAAANILGYVSKDRLTSNIGLFLANLSFVDPLQQKELVSELNQKGQVIEASLQYKREIDNKVGYALCSIRSVPGNKEQAPCYIASFTDVSDKKENEQLKIARNAAEEANKAKSQFLANMSHEIRTPLNGVTGMLELLSRSELETHQTRYIEIAQNSAQSLLSVINDILDFSKIEAGKMELDSVDFHLRDTLADVVDIFAVQTARKNIELIGDIPQSLPDWVVGDPERLRQVLINLLGNAVKFTDSGSISLHAATVKETDNIVSLDISIKDTGCGISESNLEKLFQSFTQADTSTTRKYGGTGLGLTISRQLVELMKGSINVKSKLGVGSVFSVSISLPKSSKKQEPSKRLPAFLARTRVLVVDDHPINLKLVHGLLHPFGLEIDCVESGREALAAVAKARQANTPYELLLLDYHMPEMDGLMLAADLRSQPGGSDLKIILLTSIDQITSTDEGMEHFDEALVKPVRASRLFDSIVTALQHKELLSDNQTSTDSSHSTATIVPLPSAKHGSDTASVTILLVEDNAVNQMVASTILEQADYEVEVADDGQEALDRIELGGIDLVLMDCQMPVMDGFEATRALRQREKENNVSDEQRMPIIALTANALKGDREQCMEAGMDDYITKPLELEALFAAMSAFVAIPADVDHMGDLKDTGT